MSLARPSASTASGLPAKSVPAICGIGSPTAVSAASLLNRGRALPVTVTAAP